MWQLAGVLRQGADGASATALQPRSAPLDHASGTGLGADGAAPMGRRATAAGRAATRNRNRRAATARSGADSRAAPCGASAPAAGGAAVVLERLADRGAGVLRAASRPASRLVQRPEPTDATSPMRLVVDHAVRPSRLRSSTASRVRRPSPVAARPGRASRDDLQAEGLAWTARLARRPAAGGHPRPRPRRHHHHRGRGLGRGGAAGVDADEGGPGRLGPPDKRQRRSPRRDCAVSKPEGCRRRFRAA